MSGGLRRPGTRALAADTRLLRALRTLPHSPGGDRVASAISAIADHCRMWWVIGALGVITDRRRARRWVGATATVAATEQVSRVIKRQRPRARPDLPGFPALARVTSRSSFPSSHAATAAAAVEAYRGLLPHRVLLGWAALTALSRPYLGVHYPSDVVAGLGLGAALGRLSRR